MKSSLVAVTAAVFVATLITALKDREALQESFGFGARTPELMMMGRVKGPDSDNQPVDVQTVSDRIQAATQVNSSEQTQSVAQTTQPPATPSPTSQAQSAPVQTAPAPVPVVPPATTLTAGAATTSSNPPQTSAAEQPVVDESALRYFATRGDKVRLQAEISRLQALYPNWVPPADPLAIPQNGDRQLENMWRLYSEGRYAELRKAIADRQAAESGWQPPADLLDRLDVAESRARLINASDLKQYATVVNIAAETPSLLTCAEIDVLWRVAEAFIGTNRQQRGQDAYTYILKNCTEPAERLATVQKAAALLPYGPMQALLSLEKPADANGAREFDSLRDDLARRFVADGNDDAKLDVAPDYISRVEKLAEGRQLPSDALLLGWYQLRRNNEADAEKWFRIAHQKQDSAAASQGLALALIARKSPQEAEDVMYRWRDDSKDATATYLAATANLMALQPPADLSEDVLGRIAAAAIEEKYVPTAQQFGWYARSLNQFQTAARWFETALRWKPDDEPSAYGLAVTRQQLNDRAGVAEIQRLWAGRSPRIATLNDMSAASRSSAPLPAPSSVAEQPGAAQPAASKAQTAPAESAAALRPPAQFQSQSSQVQLQPIEPARSERVMQTVTVERRPRQIRGCSTTIDPARLHPGEALARGWCLMDINRPMEAVKAFEAALASPVRKEREDAAYGQSLAYLRAGLSNNAAVAATRAPQSRDRASELQVAILADRALAAFEGRRYREALIYLDQRAQLQQERVDLMVLRGYSYMNLKMYGDATRVFEAAAATGNRDAARGLADVRSITHPEVND
ncbi:cellulose synthase [Rhizobium sp. BK650]|uniref:cellulose synthase n=1 Tax=Rhizobium sp. BK650 TaxID=2586990 RepID=UPI0016070F86|nr:cellulose synthase [Rhizobium sp. BK650]